MIIREEEGLRLSKAGTFPSKVWGLDAGQTSSFQSLCMQRLSSGFLSDAQSPLCSYRFTTENVTNIFGKSAVGEMAEDMPGWTQQPREAS